MFQIRFPAASRRAAALLTVVLSTAAPALAQEPDAAHQPPLKPAAEGTDAAPAPETTPTIDDPVVATVDDAPIRRSDVERLHGEDPRLAARPLAEVAPALIDHLIATRLLAAQAEAEGLAADPAVAARLRAADDRILARAVLERRIAAALTEADLETAYRRRLAALSGEDEVRLRIIQVATAGQAGDLAERITGGADMAALARNKSLAPSADTDGLVGWVRPSDLDPGAAEAVRRAGASGLGQGALADGSGWVVVRIEDRRPAVPPTFETLREALREDLIRRRADALVADLKAKAAIDRKPAVFR